MDGWMVGLADRQVESQNERKLKEDTACRRKEKQMRDTDTIKDTYIHFQFI
jgi:hypothetical protein